MKTLSAPRKSRSATPAPKIVSQDRALIRLAAAIVDAPEEMVLALFLAKRARTEAGGLIGIN